MKPEPIKTTVYDLLPVVVYESNGAQKEILPRTVEKLKGRIFYLHAADNDGRVNEHLAPGRGTIDWDGLFTALKKHGFEGYVAVDVGGDG